MPAVRRLLQKAAAHGLELLEDSDRLDGSGRDLAVLHATGIDGTRWILRSPAGPRSQR